MAALVLPAALALLGCTAGDPPPSTDIYLVELSHAEGDAVVGEPLNITDRAGYDNQPTFLPDGRALLYTSIGAEGQADVHRFDLATRRAVRVTETPEDEYSPTPLPGGGGFSVVRVEADGRQRLWRFDSDGDGAVLIAAEQQPVGYHAWADAENVALFILGSEEEPAVLRLLDLSTGGTYVAAEAIGRCIERIPGRRAFSFVDQSDDDTWWISEIDVETRAVRRLVRTRPGCEDYAWTAEGAVLMPCGSELFRAVPGSEEPWKKLADLGPSGLGGLTRISVSPAGDLLALVASRRED